jgi:1-acyl-sn-glycerol-3-phosphate acyltransferase
MKRKKIIIHVFQYITYIILNPIFTFFIHLKIEGVENLYGINEPYIIAPNHSSKLDPLILLIVFYNKIKHKPIYCVSKEDKLYKHLGWRTLLFRESIFSLLGGYPVYSGKGDYEKSLVNHISFIRDGYSTCIFPEGRISKDGNVVEARGGLIFLSQKTNTPIIPVATRGIFNINFFDFIMRRRNVKITICKPVVISNVITRHKSDDAFYYKEQAQNIIQIIKKHL